MFFCLSPYIIAQAKNPKFKVIAFHDGENDKGHVSFVREADKWFSEKASQHKFRYESTKNWGLLNFESIHNYDVIIFLQFPSLLRFTESCISAVYEEWRGLDGIPFFSIFAFSKRLSPALGLVS